jgi:hypothetical protein
MTSVVVSPYNVANYSRAGGHFWVYMQYAHALRRLGCEVHWLERVGTAGGKIPNEQKIAILCERLRPFGLDGNTLIYEESQSGGRRFINRDDAEAEKVIRRADLLLNFDYWMKPEFLSVFHRTALVDIDPGLFQTWVSLGSMPLTPHDSYVTTGETVGTPEASFPHIGVEWLSCGPAVALDLWPVTKEDAGCRFTTVSSWWSSEWLEDQGELYENNKRAAFLEFIELPRRTNQTLELALSLGDGSDDDRKLLEDHGWVVRDTREVAHSPADYRRYIQTSMGEFSCAKASCRRLRNAWVSDRTLCYLASGKPVVVQDTGPSKRLPSGMGMFRFSTIEEAAAGLGAIASDYERHAKAAREIAETHFDAMNVVSRILDYALEPRPSFISGGSQLTGAAGSQRSQATTPPEPPSAASRSASS